jgi:hypothetical protein
MNISPTNPRGRTRNRPRDQITVVLLTPPRRHRLFLNIGRHEAFFMGEHAITGKLASELSNVFDSEARVVYLLVQIRKLLEIYSQEQKYSILHLFANWAVHNELTNKTARQWADRFQALHRLNYEEALKLKPYISFTVLRGELDAFLLEHGLPCDKITANANSWRSFAGHLAQILLDVPLLIQSGAGHEVRLSGARVEHVAAGDRLHLRWTSNVGGVNASHGEITIE